MREAVHRVPNCNDSSRYIIKLVWKRSRKFAFRQSVLDSEVYETLEQCRTRRDSDVRRKAVDGTR